MAVITKLSKGYDLDNPSSSWAGGYFDVKGEPRSLVGVGHARARPDARFRGRP